MGGRWRTERQMANAGVRVLGRVVAGSDARLAIARNANAVLDEADAAFAGFAAAAREFAAAHPDIELPEDEATGPGASTVAEVDSSDLRRENVAAIVWATGYDYDFGWLTGARWWMPADDRSSNAGSARCPGFTSSAFTRCTPSSPAHSRVSAPTRSTSPTTGSDDGMKRSPHAHMSWAAHPRDPGATAPESLPARLQTQVTRKARLARRALEASRTARSKLRSRKSSGVGIHLGLAEIVVGCRLPPPTVQPSVGTRTQRQ